jgi:G:T-mismatch repair DNA endonuclease (very short patch repair protein)
MRKGIPRSAVRKHNRKRPKSSIEKLVAAWLEADGIPFRTEVKVGKCHVDIVIGKKGAVELNGCYWHCCHRCYPVKTQEQKLKRFRDIHRYQFLGHRGFKLVVLWECDILNKPDETREKLRGFAKNVC